MEETTVIPEVIEQINFADYLQSIGECETISTDETESTDDAISTDETIPTDKKKVRDLENRFKSVSGLIGDLSKFPIKKEDRMEFSTDKNKSREFAEVFTPLYIVDEMLQTIPDGGMGINTRNMDLCSGYGQFSIRMIRKLYNDNSDFNLNKYLQKYHFFNELQISSCYKLLWIFGSKINLAIGDALELGKLPVKAQGIWYYLKPIDIWINITGLIKLLFFRYKNGTAYNTSKDGQFVEAFNSIVNRLEHTCKEYKMCIKKIISTKEGRQRLLRVINDAADGVEVNWQDKETPEKTVHDMVKTIPDLGKLKKILVLFNIEFLECLVREKKIDLKKIDFGYDSELEGLFASSVYKVGTFSVGKNLSELVENTKDKTGYDVIFSNPPYQVMDEGHGASAGPIYNKIIEHVIDSLNPRYLSMITPSRWMAGGKGLNNFRARMLKDKRLRLIRDYPDTNKVFKNVNISGGVNYFLWDRDYNGYCKFNSVLRDINEFDILVRDNISVEVLKEVLSKATAFCNERVLPSKPFSLRTFFKDWVSEGTPGAVKCFKQLKGDNIRYTLAENIKDEHGVLGKWKVLTSSANGAGQICDKTGAKSVLAGNIISKPAEVCTETLIITNFFSNKKEAVNYASYMKTKFYRFMLSLRVISQHITREKFSWVPEMPNYSKPWTDQDLYRHFDLAEEHIDHIEKSIKSLD